MGHIKLTQDRRKRAIKRNEKLVLEYIEEQNAVREPYKLLIEGYFDSAVKRLELKGKIEYNKRTQRYRINR